MHIGIERRPARRGLAVAFGLALTLSLAACGDPEEDEAGPADGGAGSSEDAGVNTSPDQDRIRTDEVADIAALVPEEIRDRGTLEVVNSVGTVPPLNFYATDDETVIGVETDIATLVGDVLGLEVEFSTVDWANIFVGLDSGRYDAGFGNITVTEERKDKYDFATYRLDNVAFEAQAGADWSVEGPEDVAGRTIGVGSGTNQEQILISWSEQNVAAGLEPTDIRYYQNATDYYLALSSGRLDAYLGPNPSAVYHARISGDTEIIGSISGAGDELQGEIAATTKKDNGLVEALAAALNEVIENGSYGEVLDRWGLAGEAVEKSRINPPGLPRQDG
ncbi:ABC transporter substrate-binding protein [Streptomyces radicis]|uniref:ABC transporter substrate-binding protein n=1 Tax=Streptomyces radicis TaxID=1750517 RepID=A0A3A9VQK1_9ACTN|nr:ABC transporter substrate-binding protein [Streptomyces radicis]RKN03218.1 ABC transporter substrate-binding protein [Streptomyces radicis]RKN13119.1 ABC transporter substrate-binding protein [Streptomyces radicis]